MQSSPAVGCDFTKYFLTLEALDVRISSPTKGTFADRTVSYCLAFCWFTAGTIWYLAWILALAIQASIIRWAFSIWAAPWDNYNKKRVTSVFEFSKVSIFPYLESIFWMDLLSYQVGTCKWAHDPSQSKLLVNCKDCLWHKDSHKPGSGKPERRGTHNLRSSQFQLEQLEKVINVVWNWFFTNFDDSLPMGSHCRSPFPVNPGSQTQTIVLNGKSSWTVQAAFGAQGLILRQGFSQSPSKQASLLGQSASCLQELSSGTGRGTNKE